MRKLVLLLLAAGALSACATDAPTAVPRAGVKAANAATGDSAADLTATLSPDGMQVTVGGTLSCPFGDSAKVLVSVTQHDQWNGTVEGSGNKAVPCTGASQRWLVPIFQVLGFHPGGADAVVWINPGDTGQVHLEGAVQIQRASTTPPEGFSIDPVGSVSPEGLQLALSGALVCPEGQLATVTIAVLQNVGGAGRAEADGWLPAQSCTGESQRWAVTIFQAFSFRAGPADVLVEVRIGPSPTYTYVTRVVQLRVASTTPPAGFSIDPGGIVSPDGLQVTFGGTLVCPEGQSAWVTANVIQEGRFRMASAVGYVSVAVCTGEPQRWAVTVFPLPGFRVGPINALVYVGDWSTSTVLSGAVQLRIASTTPPAGFSIDPAGSISPDGTHITFGGTFICPEGQPASVNVSMMQEGGRFGWVAGYASMPSLTCTGEPQHWGVTIFQVLGFRAGPINALVGVSAGDPPTYTDLAGSVRLQVASMMPPAGFSIDSVGTISPDGMQITLGGTLACPADPWTSPFVSVSIAQLGGQVGEVEAWGSTDVLTCPGDPQRWEVTIYPSQSFRSGPINALVGEMAGEAYTQYSGTVQLRVARTDSVSAP